MGLRAEGNDDRGAARLLIGPAAATRQGPQRVESGRWLPVQNQTSPPRRRAGSLAVNTAMRLRVLLFKSCSMATKRCGGGSFLP